MGYTVYKHTSPSGKVYIGITKRKPEYRWNKGKGYRKDQLLFYRAIKKYGWDNFTHEILYTGLSEKDAKNIEISLIRQCGVAKAITKWDFYVVFFGDKGWTPISIESSGELKFQYIQEIPDIVIKTQ